jgi:hypothetical protein
MNTWAKRAANYATRRSVYPASPGANVGQIGSANSSYTNDPQARMVGAAAGEATDPNPGRPRSLFGMPLTWYLVLIVVFFALQFAAKKAGEGDDFRNIRLSSYNILTITLAASLGIATMKVLFSKFTVPGLSEFWQAV